MAQMKGFFRRIEKSIETISKKSSACKIRG